MTGGCGFIGSNFVLDWLKIEHEPVVVLDSLTYAGNLQNLEKILNQDLFTFINGNINNKELVEHLLRTYRPRAILNFAAESHVDRSIYNPENFIHSNINGAFVLLEAAKCYWSKLSAAEAMDFRYLQISTDEVFGSLLPDDLPFKETSPYKPKNPYSASKAAADHLVAAYHLTYGIPTLITNCSNNYGPYQLPEKLIPLTISNALAGKPIFVYGDGLHVRDWLYVIDHCRAIKQVLEMGKVGESYNIGAHCEKTNLTVVQMVCEILDELSPNSNHVAYASLITHITDRLGHDRRYAIDSSKITQDLGWKPFETFTSGMQKTISWYLSNIDWIDQIQHNTTYQQWINTNYTDRVLA